MSQETELARAVRAAIREAFAPLIADLREMRAQAEAQTAERRALAGRIRTLTDELRSRHDVAPSTTGAHLVN
ncbi:MAG TPA: hypothetical protein VK251_03705 [Steroidobacteraceae bacterium]|nr:hypothetical protein [Steroidobacteraceae bacterium]